MPEHFVPAHSRQFCSSGGNDSGVPRPTSAANNERNATTATGLTPAVKIPQQQQQRMPMATFYCLKQSSKKINLQLNTTARRKQLRSRLKIASSSISLGPTTHPKDRLHCLRFRLKKLFSEMDLRKTRNSIFANSFASAARQSNPWTLKTIHLAHGRVQPVAANAVALRTMQPRSVKMRKLCALVSAERTAQLQRKLNQDVRYCMLHIHTSGLKIFNSMLLNAFRKRRDEITRLNREINVLNRNALRFQDQHNNLTNVIRMEQRRAEEQTLEARRHRAEYIKKNRSFEKLKAAMQTLREEKGRLQQEVNQRDEDISTLNVVVKANSSELFKTVTQQRELQTELASEQRRAQELEQEKADLLSEICVVSRNAAEKEQLYKQELLEKNAEIHAAANEKEKLKDELAMYQQQFAKCYKRERKLKASVEDLQLQVAKLKQQIAASFGERLKAYWRQSLAFQKSTFNLIHFMIYCILPATPPPKKTAPLSEKLPSSQPGNL